MKKVFFIVLLILFAFDVIAQLKKIEGKGIYTERDIYLDAKGKRYSTQVSVHFFQQTLTGVSYSLENLNDSNLKQLLTIIKKDFGSFKLSKAYKDKQWGDSISTNIVTKKNVFVRDLSQIYHIEFNKLICVDEVIDKLKKTKLFRSVWAPVCKTDMFSPNDYNPTTQWGLNNAEATKAWDITKGSPLVRLAGCESSKWDLNNPGPLHTELQGEKIIVNFGNYAGGHGQQVLGVAGGLTNNNSSSIASIGFKTGLMWFNKGHNDIQRARNNNADIINMSWHYWWEDGDTEAQIYSALQEGRIIVAAAGNAKISTIEPDRPFVTYPAAYNFGAVGQVIAVSATGKNRTNLSRQI